jgi:hypothetical protein
LGVIANVIHSQTEQWEKATPQELRPAIAHVRQLFDEARWKWSQVTQRFAYAALHPEQAAAAASLVPYESAFQICRQIVGPTNRTEFDELVSRGSPSCVFKAHFDMCCQGHAAEIRLRFSEFWQIGRANSEGLNAAPVEWARSHAQLLIRDSALHIGSWIKSVCDVREPYQKDKDPDCEELIFWRSWRAPMFLHMQPSGNTPFDSATAWAREDKNLTEQLLDGLSRKFTQALGMELSALSGAAHVRLAQAPPVPRSAGGAAPAPMPQQTRAPRPPSIVHGRSSPPRVKATQPILEYPPGFPGYLHARTAVIIGGAVKKFPNQMQTRDLCAFVTAELSPHMLAAVDEKTLRSDMALTLMGELLRSLIACNCDNASDMFRLQQQTRSCDEWLQFAEELARRVDSDRRSREPATTQPLDWGTIEIVFLSDERVQIRNGVTTETLNYGEFGFEDGRSGKPNQAWLLLRALAENGGVLRDGASAGIAWPKVERRIQEIRQILRNHFSAATDPVPFVEGTGYRTLFKICCGASYKT